MKRTFSTLFMLLMGAFAFCQSSTGEDPMENVAKIFYGDRIQSGTILSMANISYSSQKTEFDGDDQGKTSQFSAQVMGLYALQPNLAVGIGIDYSINTQTSYPREDAELINRENLILVLPAVRYLSSTLYGAIQPYAQLEVPIGFGGSETETEDETLEGPDINTIGANLGVGSNFYVSPCFAFEIYFGLLSFSRRTAEFESGDETRDDLDIGFRSKNLSLGVCYLWNTREPLP